jgi:hypothetical protein
MSQSVILLVPLLVIPGLALVVSLVCRRHGVLLCLGGLIVVPLGAFVLWLNLSEGLSTGELGTAVTMLTYAAIPILAAGAVLLVGGLLRWQNAGRERQPGTAGEPEAGGPSPR